jgi:diguanylate cyclase (GGDEF)-like protein/PAS domain S-box-containing protein
MALVTALCLTCLGVALTLRLQTRLAAERGPMSADTRVNYISTVLLVGISLISVLVAFATVKNGTEETIRRDLQQVVEARRALLLANLRSANALARSVSVEPSIVNLLVALQASNGPGENRRALADAGRRLREVGIASIQFTDVHGAPLMSTIEPDPPELAVPLKGEFIGSSLLWDGGLVLESSVPLSSGGVVRARATVRVPLVAASEMLFAAGRAQSEELKLCARLDGATRCFPSRLVARVHPIAEYQEGSNAEPFPITLALRGQSGSERFRDVRGRAILGAYVPLDDLGLGMVQRIESRDVFAPVQSLLLQVVTIPLLLALGGALILRSRVRPLVTRVIDSERSAQQARGDLKASEVRLRSISDNLPAIISYTDAEQRYRFVNEHMRRVFGLDPQSMLGRTMQEVCEPELWADLAPYVARALAGERVTFEGTARIGGELHYHQTDYIPDTQADGRVTGFYALTFDITERKLSEFKHRADEHRLRTITNHMPGAVSYLDNDERYEFANAYYGDALGIDPASMIGRTVREVLGERNYERIRAKLAQSRSGYPASWDYYLETPGRHRDLQGHYLPDYAEDNTVRGTFVISYDVTERKRAEEALKKSEERFRLMADGVHDYVILSLDPEGLVETWNAGAEHITGYSAEEIVGRHFELFYPEQARAAELPAALLETALRVGRVEHEGWRLRRDGTHFWADVSITALRSDDGLLRGFGEVTRDLSESKAAAEALKASEQQMRTIADNLPVLICYIDRSQVFRYNNRQYERWLRRPVAEITGRPLREVYSAEVYLQLAPTIERALAGETIRAEIEFTGWDGNSRYARVTYLPDRDDSGQVLGVHGLSSDITTQRRAERELWRLAQYDTLTGLPNRTQFNEKFAIAMRGVEVATELFALMFLDIDKFKAINDACGHQVGDEVLKEFARRLLASVRPTDTVCRLAGDEFVILLTGLHAPDEAQFVARKILHAMRADFVVFEQQHLHVSTSIGIAVRRDGELDPAELLRRADEALYQAKDAGRNGFKFIA